jgi:hypothetical protein
MNLDEANTRRRNPDDVRSREAGGPQLTHARVPR